MENLLNTVRNLGPFKTLGFIAIILSVLGFVSYFINMANTPEMGLLYNNIDEIEGAKVVEKLKSTGTPYEIKANGNQILAPVNMIAELRMQLALDGIIMSGGIGYELFDRSDVLGTSSAMLDINQIRALEGELARSIKGINEVQAARVHLVIAKRELFSKEKSQASASVVLKMKNNQRLSSDQIQAIQALVSSSVPNMTSDRISIIDDKGTLLARSKDSTGGDSFAQQVNIREEYEEKTARQIEQLLERTLGPERIRAEVSVEMDFDKITSQAVEFNPEGQVARSVNTSEEGIKSDESNGGGDAVNVQKDANNNQQQGAASTSKNTTNKTEEVTSYEISNKTITTVKETGTIKRISVAVLVDGNYKVDGSGNKTYEARSDEEIKQLTELVQTAVGFKSERGDSIKVINLKFATPEEIKMQEVDWMTKTLHSIDVKRLIELLIVGIFSLIILFTFLKPAVFSLLKIVAPTMVKASSDKEIPHHSENQYMPPQGYSGYGPAYGGQPYGGYQQGPFMPQQMQQPQYIPQQVVSMAQPQQLIIQGGGGAPQIIHTESSVNDTVSLSNVLKKKSGLSQKLDDFEKDVDLEQVDGRVKSSSITRISNLVRKNPDETVSLLRAWLYEEGDD
ncbi:MAG: flagellar M-ring protein FliF [Proteobacteria bacterium]|nr:flagellar M-ring protein FliF [Pseudomonadota bacterium]